MDENIAKAFLASQLAVVFVNNQPEILEMFTEWVKKNHDDSRGGKCTDENCIYSQNDTRWWRVVLSDAYDVLTDCANILESRSDPA